MHYLYIDITTILKETLTYFSHEKNHELQAKYVCLLFF